MTAVVPEDMKGGGKRHLTTVILKAIEVHGGYDPWIRVAHRSFGMEPTVTVTTTGDESDSQCRV